MRTIALVALATCLAGCPSGGDDAPTFRIVEQDLPGAVLSFSGQSTSDLFAVGGDLGDPGQALILWYNGTSWQRMPTTVEATLWWVHRFAHDDVWAVGDPGTILHFDGTSWFTSLWGQAYTVWGIWGATPDDVWAVGGAVDHSVDSVLMHWDGLDWTMVDSVRKPNDMYFKIWGTSASDIWAVSEKGVIIHYDGSAWTEQPSGTTQRLITVFGRGSDDVYAVGGVTSSVLLHNDGTGWQQLDMDLGAGLMGVWTAPGQDVFVAGFRGATGLGDGSDWTALPYLTTDCLHATWGDGHGVILAGGGNLLSGGNATGTIIGTGDIAGGAITDWQP